MTREIIYPTFVVVLIASIWAMGWEKAHTDRLEEYRPRFSHYDEDGLTCEAEVDDPARSSVTSTFDVGDE